MMAAHSLVRIGYSWESVQEMDEWEVKFWVDTAHNYNKHANQG